MASRLERRVHQLQREVSEHEELLALTDKQIEDAQWRWERALANYEDALTGGNSSGLKKFGGVIESERDQVGSLKSKRKHVLSKLETLREQYREAVSELASTDILQHFKSLSTEEQFEFLEELKRRLED